ncbi:MAG: DNA alkylation repair protein [Carboxylicivirga sp.]|jgi:3-methyladenine DNA glycosylase AlkD|nr:DNA alkylation repair protein [Carboxylicivirga sp.]
MHPIINTVRKELIAAISQKTLNSIERFFKEEIFFYGVSMPNVKSISKTHFKTIKELPKSQIFDLCEELFQSGNLEESIVACHWSYALKKQYEPEDFVRFKHWVNNYINNWATCDTFCNHTIGDFVKMYPEFVGELLSFTQSPNRWMRRAAAVSLIVPAKKGLFMNIVFQIADALLTDEDDLVRKGYGWMLKVTSQAHERPVFEYVMQHKDVMPRVSLRYAIEKMPKELRVEAMKK